MSMQGNPYAEVLKDYEDPRNSIEAVATLALAYEQRTANLIALAAHDRIGGYVAPADLYKTIEARLGL